MRCNRSVLVVVCPLCFPAGSPQPSLRLRSASPVTLGRGGPSGQPQEAGSWPATRFGGGRGAYGPEAGLHSGFPFASFSGLVITAFSGSRTLRSWQEPDSELTPRLPGQASSEGAEHRVEPTRKEGCFVVSLFPAEPAASQ